MTNDMFICTFDSVHQMLTYKQRDQRAEKNIKKYEKCLQHVFKITYVLFVHYHIIWKFGIYSRGPKLWCTPNGLFVFNRLVYGVTSAAAFFSREQWNMSMQEFSNVKTILDDMLITEKSQEAQIKMLKLVSARLQGYGVKVNPGKCKFFHDSIVFCAHRIDKEGIQKTGDKIEAVI